MRSRVTINGKTWESDEPLTVAHTHKGTTIASTSKGAALSAGQIDDLAARATAALVAELNEKKKARPSLATLAHWCRTMIGRA